MAHNNLRKLRNEKKLTQEKLCVELLKCGLEIKRKTYSKYETGNRKISCEMLIKFAEYFGTSTDYILGITDDPVPFERSKNFADSE